MVPNTHSLSALFAHNWLTFLCRFDLILIIRFAGFAFPDFDAFLIFCAEGFSPIYVRVSLFLSNSFAFSIFHHRIGMFRTLKQICYLLCAFVCLSFYLIIFCISPDFAAFHFSASFRVQVAPSAHCCLQSLFIILFLLSNLPEEWNEWLR